MREILTPYDDPDPVRDRFESPGTCPICGGLLYFTDTVYLDSQGEILGCENCVQERTWGDVA